MPEISPLTTPDPEPTVATEVLLLLQVPPPASLSEVDEPIHTLFTPEMAAGNGLTVTTFRVVHPVPSVYVMVEVPKATPVTRPEPETTVATEDVLLVHVPPPASLREVVKPAQTAGVPEIPDGNGLTVSTVVIKQPVPKVYVIVDVPDNNPATVPDDDPTVATEVELLLQEPPPASLNVVFEPTHNDPDPEMDAGNGLTVVVTKVMQPVGSV